MGAVEPTLALPRLKLGEKMKPVTVEVLSLVPVTYCN
jgi:hypothetical protein